MIISKIGQTSSASSQGDIQMSRKCCILENIQNSVRCFIVIIVPAPILDISVNFQTHISISYEMMANERTSRVEQNNTPTLHKAI